MRYLEIGMWESSRRGWVKKRCNALKHIDSLKRFVCLSEFLILLKIKMTISSIMNWYPNINQKLENCGFLMSTVPRLLFP